MKDYLDFESRLRIGKDFEEKANRFFTEQGFPIGLNLSAERQWEFGESAAHVEIKLDQDFQETGNLFIEIEERRDTVNSRWRRSGIYDESDPWFYAIGSRLKMWLLPVRWLRKIHKKGKRREVINKQQTAKGFLLPVLLADEISIRSWAEWDEKQIPSEMSETQTA